MGTKQNLLCRWPPPGPPLTLDTVLQPQWPLWTQVFCPHETLCHCIFPPGRPLDSEWHSTMKRAAFFMKKKSVTIMWLAGDHIWLQTERKSHWQNTFIFYVLLKYRPGASKLQLLPIFENEILLGNNSHAYSLHVFHGGSHRMTAELGTVTDAVKQLLKPKISSLWPILRNCANPSSRQ